MHVHPTKIAQILLLATLSLGVTGTALACPTAGDCPMGSVVRDFSGSGSGVMFNAATDPAGVGVNYCIIGSGFNDSIVAGNGNDIVCSGDGADFINAGGGDNNLDGGNGDDSLLAYGGMDTLVGGEGNDLLRSGDGDDNVSGGGGNDTIYTYGGADTIDTGDGANLVKSGDGDDNITGGTGVDYLFGDGGNDTIAGGDSADYLYGGEGNDAIDAGNGADVIYAGNGDDTVLGGAGRDLVFADDQGGAGNDTVSGGDAADTIYGGGGDDTLNGDSGDDFITGDDGNDTIDGGDQNDSLFGGNGNDTVLGGNGDDNLSGGNGDDTLRGQFGEDTLNGDGGNDVVDGGNDDGSPDNLSGGGGQDTCIDDNSNETIVGGCENLTRATVASFETAVSGRDVVVSWTTASEVGTLGFDVYRREVGSQNLVRVNEHLLQAVQTAPEGGSYQLLDSGARAGTEYEYVLVEQESNRKRFAHGPFLRRAFGRPATAALSRTAFFAAEPRAIARRIVPEVRRGAFAGARLLEANGVSRIKATVGTDGLTTLSATSLAESMGLTLDAAKARIAAGTLKLVLAGAPVAWTPSADGESIEFYGERGRTLYSKESVYLLEAGAGAVMATENTTAPEGAPAASFRTAVKAEEDTFAARVIPLSADQDYWFWQVVSPTTPGKTKATVTVAAAELAPGASAGAITVEIQGASDEGVAGEHRALVKVNGTTVGTLEFEGYTLHTETFAVAPGVLVAGENTVEVVGELPAGVDANFMYLNSVELAYDRTFVAAGESLEFASGAAGVIEVTGLVSDDVRLWNVTDHANPRSVSGFSVADGALRFAPQANARYLVTSAAGSAPVELWTDAEVDLKAASNDANYVIITRGDFVTDAARLAAHREAAGLKAKVVDLEDIYDQFSGSQPNPNAIRTFLAYATANWKTAPKYVVLGGAGHYDYRNLRGFGGNVVPPLEVGTDVGLIASDVRYSDVEGDDLVPDLAIGRLPAATAEEFGAIVDKLIAYDTADASDWKNDVVFVADLSDETSNFVKDSEKRVGALPASFTVHEVHRTDALPLADARTILLDQFDAGAGWINYLGHGGVDRWARGAATDGVLMNADAEALTNGARLPLVTAMTCLSSAFDIPGFDAIGEVLVRNPNGGAVAVWGASTSSIHEEARILLDGFIDGTMGDHNRVLGDAVLQASRSFADRETENGGRMLEMYALLGDPATPLQYVAPKADEPSDDDDTPMIDDNGDGTAGGNAGGCSVSGDASASAGALWLLAGLGLVLGTRRRRR
jgi:MYXO-CTERM domain-containing protein